MNVKDILKACDHTLLSPSATDADILNLCDEGMEFGTASVCIPPSFVKMAKEYVKDRLAICTVIGFPNGYSKKEVKVCEAKAAVLDGADEIDMVINIGLLKMKKYEELADEISAVREATKGKILKVIIETCLLTDEEKVKMCEIVHACRADFIKTSTGFSTAGACAHDVDIFRENAKPPLKIKAAGGIKTLADAEDFINRGAERLGTSRIVKILKSQISGNENSY